MLRRLALVGLVAALFAGLWRAGFFELLAEPERAKAVLGGLGLWAPVLYVAFFSMLTPFFVPALAFAIPGAIVFSYPTLFLLSWLGAIGAGIVGFAFARYLASDFVAQRLSPRFDAHVSRLAERGLALVVVVRLTFFVLPPSHWFLGLSKVRFGTFVLGTAIGLLPGMAILTWVVSFLGGRVSDWLASEPAAPRAELWLALAVAIAFLFLLRRRRAAAAASSRL